MIIVICHGNAPSLVTAGNHFADKNGMRRCLHTGNHLAEEPAASVLLNDGNSFSQHPMTNVRQFIRVPARIETERPDHRPGRILGKNGHCKQSCLSDALVTVIVVIHTDGYHVRRVCHLKYRVDNTCGGPFLVLHSNRIHPVGQTEKHFIFHGSFTSTE